MPDYWRVTGLKKILVNSDNHGHTHRAEIHETGDMTFVNPGSFTGYYSSTGSTYAVVEVDDGQVIHAKIERTEE